MYKGFLLFTCFPALVICRLSDDSHSAAAAAPAKSVQSCPTLCNPQTAAHQAPPSLGFSRQEHWSGLPFPSPMHESEKWKWNRLVVSDSERPHGLQPTRLLHPWYFPGKSTGVGCHCLLRIAILTGVKLYHCCLDLHCSNNHQCWASLHVPISHLYVFFARCLFGFSAHFLIEWFVFSILSCMSCLCILSY